MITVYYTFIISPIGNINVTWLEEPVLKLLSINLPNGNYNPKTDNYILKVVKKLIDIENNLNFVLVKDRETYPEFIKLFCNNVNLYFTQKKPLKYPDEYLFLEALSIFTQKILIELYKTSYGQLTSYKELSEKAGHEKASRAVGNVMNKNPYPLLFPCHRVIKSDGTIGGFAPGTDMKKILLDHEGSLDHIK